MKVTFDNQPVVFLRLVCSILKRNLAQNPPPQSMEDALTQLRELLDMIACNLTEGDSPAAALENLAEVAAMTIWTAHSVGMENLSDEELSDLIESATLDAQLAEADLSAEKPASAVLTAADDKNGFADFRGGSAAMPASGAQPENPS